MSLELVMTASFARARARGSPRELTPDYLNGHCSGVASRSPFVWNDRPGKIAEGHESPARATNLHLCTDARVGSKTCHFLPFFESASGCPTRRTSSVTSFDVHGSEPNFAILGDQKVEWHVPRRIATFELPGCSLCIGGRHLRGLRRTSLSWRGTSSAASSRLGSPGTSPSRGRIGSAIQVWLCPRVWAGPGVGRVETTVRASFHLLGRGTAMDLRRYLLWLSAFPYGFKAFRPAIGGGSRQRARWDFFGVNRPILSHPLLLIWNV